MGEVAVHGKIITFENRELRTGNFMVIFDVTDYSDTITVKMFTKKERIDEVLEAVKIGSNILIKGVSNIDKFDGELVLSSVAGIKKADEVGKKRMDHSLKKRVELHCHSKMSEMDAVASVPDLLKCAQSWGHTCLLYTSGTVPQISGANFGGLSLFCSTRSIIKNPARLCDPKQSAGRPIGKQLQLSKQQAKEQADGR